MSLTKTHIGGPILSSLLQAEHKFADRTAMAERRDQTPAESPYLASRTDGLPQARYRSGLLWDGCPMPSHCHGIIPGSAAAIAPTATYAAVQTSFHLRYALNHCHVELLTPSVSAPPFVSCRASLCQTTPLCTSCPRPSSAARCSLALTRPRWRIL